MEFRVLGPLEVVVAGEPVALGGPKQRAVLAMLLLEAGRPVSNARLIDELWQDAERGGRSLQVYISELRRIMRDPRRIRSERGSYRLTVGPDELDAAIFEGLADTGGRLILAGDPEQAATTLARGLGMWRGEPYADLAGELFIVPEVERLRALRSAATENWIEAELALGHHAQLIPQIEGLVAAEPLREGPRRQLMLALYRAGRQAEALAVYHDARRVLADDLGLEPGPELEQVQLQILRQDPNLDVEPVEIRRRRDLPAPATELVGRRREIDAIVAILASDARLVTVTGPGGVGKSRVALQAADESAPRFPDGVVFVDLAVLGDPRLVSAQIATTVGVIDARDPLLALGEHLADRTMLLVLDNFEQVDEAAPVLAALLSSARNVRLLVTSRHRLRLYGEHEFALEPLDLDEEAVPLFLKRAAATAHVVGHMAGVPEICTRLDRLPLAIELAAARVREFSPAQMLTELSRLELASDGPRDVPDRQKTLERAISWSYELLSADHRERLACLSVFAGGFTADAALIVARATAADLVELRRRSLITEGARGAILETIREYSTTRLVGLGREDEARLRHADWALSLAEEADAAIREGSEPGVWLDRLEEEHGNLRAALDWSSFAHPGLALALAVALGSFWEFRGHIAEGDEQLARALRGAPEADGSLRARGYLRSGVFANMRGDLDESAGRLERSLEIARNIDDRVTVGKALRNIGTLAKDRGDYRRALELHHEARQLSLEIDDWLGVSTSLINLADVSLASSDDRAARRYADEAADLARTHGHDMRLVMSLLNVGLAHIRLGNSREAAEAYDEALELCDRHRISESAAYGMIGLAAMAVATGQPRQAAILLGAADEQLAAAGAVLESTERPLRDSVLEQTRRQLGDVELSASLTAGAGLSLSEAVRHGRRLAATLATTDPESTARRAAGSDDGHPRDA